MWDNTNSNDAPILVLFRICLYTFSLVFMLPLNSVYFCYINIAVTMCKSISCALLHTATSKVLCRDIQ